MDTGSRSVQVPDMTGPRYVQATDITGRRSVQVPDLLLRHPKHKPNLEELEPGTLPRGIRSPSVGGSVAFNKRTGPSVQVPDITGSRSVQAPDITGPRSLQISDTSGSRYAPKIKENSMFDFLGLVGSIHALDHMEADLHFALMRRSMNEKNQNP